MAHKISTYWHTFMHLGVKDTMPVSKQKKVILSNYLSVFTFLLFFIPTLTSFIILFDRVSSEPTYYLSLLSIMSMLSVPFMNRRSEGSAGFMLSVITPVLSFFFALMSIGEMENYMTEDAFFDTRSLLLACVILPLSLIDKSEKWKMALALFVCLLCYTLYAPFETLILEHNNLIIKGSRTVRWIDMRSVVPFALITGGALFLLHINQLYENRISQLAEELSQKNSRITDSITYARRIQAAILPGQQALAQSLTDYFILFRPRDIVSGDFYFLEHKDGMDYIAVADCTGHGVPGAFVSMLGFAFLVEIIHEQKEPKSNEILELLRSKIKQAFKTDNETESPKDGMDIAFCVFDRDQKKLCYSGAYNPLYRIRNNELTEYKATRSPIGHHKRELPFVSETIDAQPGDCFYMFSDGYVDQIGGATGDKFKSHRFRELLLSICNLPLHEQHEALEKNLDNWMQAAENKQRYEQVDDILVIGFKLI